MASLDVVHSSNPIIRKKSKAVNRITLEITKLIKDMVATMYDRNGVGLAAIQVGQPLRIFVFDISEDRDEPQAIINPKLIHKEGRQTGVEGCLSVPGLEGEVERYQKVVVKGKNIKFEDIEIEADEFLAVVLQHELDHLEGVLYIDKVNEGTLKPVDKKKKHEEVDI